VFVPVRGLPNLAIRRGAWYHLCILLERIERIESSAQETSWFEKEEENDYIISHALSLPTNLLADLPSKPLFRQQDK